MTNKKLGLVLVVIVAIAIGGYFLPVAQNAVERVVEKTVGAFPSPTIYEALELLGGTTFGKVNSTSTLATSYTLLARDVVGFDTVVITPNVGDITLTLPASSTMPHFVPKVGQRVKQCWVNATTTSGIDITFAAGTGIDLEYASSTESGAGVPALTILANSSACFEFIRKPVSATAFDIVAQFTRFVDGD